MNILITGASGFVGGALHKRLCDRGTHRVLGVGRRARATADYEQMDLTLPIVSSFVPDVVVHAAARATPWGTLAEFRRQNVDATRNVIEFCAQIGNPRLVYVSTSAVFYRNADQYDLDEASPIGPDFVNAYARTKREGEELVERYDGSWIVMRPRAVFGPGDTTVFPRVVAAARAGRLPRFRRNGEPARSDLVYIDTLCAYLEQAIASTASGAYNVTNDEPIETERFIFDILTRLGIETPTRTIDPRVAFAAAAATEAFFRIARPNDEPPITRFGVAAVAYSKTFDVRKLIAQFGPPSVSIAEGTERFVRSFEASA